MEEHAQYVWYEDGKDVWAMRWQGERALFGRYEDVVGDDAQEETGERASAQREVRSMAMAKDGTRSSLHVI